MIAAVSTIPAAHHAAGGQLETPPDASSPEWSATVSLGQNNQVIVEATGGPLLIRTTAGHQISLQPDGLCLGNDVGQDFVVRRRCRGSRRYSDRRCRHFQVFRRPPVRDPHANSVVGYSY